MNFKIDLCEKRSVDQKETFVVSFMRTKRLTCPGVSGSKA